MKNIVGSPVEGKDFFGRETEVARLRDTLETDDVLLLGPRRIGKTSAAREVMAQVRAQGWGAVEINVAACVDERGFVAKLRDKLRPELASLASRAMGAAGSAVASLGAHVQSAEIGLPGGPSINLGLGKPKADDWTREAGDLLQLLTKADKRWLMYVDELPIFLFNVIRNDAETGVQRARRFLDWFRNDVRALPGADNLRWLVSGSVGLDTLVQQHGMADTINSMNHQGLDAFTDEVAVAMLCALIASYKIALTDADALALVRAVQWSQPYYLQRVFHHLRALLPPTPPADLSKLIETAIDKLAEPGSDNDFHHWESRLALQLGRADADHACALLKLAARDPNGVRPEVVLAVIEGRMPHSTPEEARRKFIGLRDILLRDGYWWPDESSGARRYRFRLEPLRRWWLRRDTL